MPESCGQVALCDPPGDDGARHDGVGGGDDGPDQHRHPEGHPTIRYASKPPTIHISGITIPSRTKSSRQLRWSTLWAGAAPPRPGRRQA